jgi:adenylosuccinate synthase
MPRKQVTYGCSYYGGYYAEKKPTHGVHYLILDEYIRRSVDKERENFNKEIQKILTSFAVLQKQHLKQHTDELKKLSSFVYDINKLLKLIIKANNLIAIETVKQKDE